MRVKTWKSWFVAICIAGILDAPPASLACGPFIPRALFTLERSPDYPTEKFVQGELGVVQPTYRMHYLFVAYRYLSGRSLDPAEQRAVLGLWDYRFRQKEAQAPEDAQEAWFKARRKVFPVNPGGWNHYSVNRELPGENTYGWFLNCPDDAFRSAALTLSQRIQRFGAESREVRSWVQAQDQVFANCSGGAVIPVPAPTDFGPVIRADRTYQIAAAHFYSGDFGAAEAGFSEIAEDVSSPWHDIAPYLVARTLIRKATLSGGYRQFDVATMTRAENQLQRVTDDPKLETLHPAALRLLSYVRIRLHPERRLRELEAALLRPRAGETLRNDFEEYTYLLKRVDGKEPDEFTDWHMTFAATGQGALEHSLKKWKETSSLPWLVACLAKVDEDNAELPALLAAAAMIRPDSPAYLTVAYHRLRLMLDGGHGDEVRSQLDSLLAHQGKHLPVSSRNLFLSMRLSLARDLDELLKYSVRQISGTTYYYGEEFEASSYGDGSNSRARRDYLDPSAAQFLNEQMPLSLLLQVMVSDRFPQPIQRDLVQAVWVRAAILGNDNVAQGALRALERQVPEMMESLTAYRSAPNAEERRFAAAMILLGNPGLRPYVTSGLDRETPIFKIDSFRENWWCFLGLGVAYDIPNYAKFQITDGARAWLKGMHPDYSEDLPDILNEAQRRTAANEQRLLHATGSGPSYMSRQVIEWAKKHPDDSRVPEALHLAVRSTRYGCTDAETSKYSKAAFQLLHRRYPKSEWAKKTKYWY